MPHRRFDQPSLRRKSCQQRRLLVERLEDRRVLANSIPVAGVYGAELVRDINTIPRPISSSPGNLVAVNGVSYFTATTPATGTELWRSDGTTAGTRLVRDIRPGPYGSSPIYLTNVSGTLYFFADDGVHRSELWRSDGTEGGTWMVKDAAPEDRKSGPSFPQPKRRLTNVNGTLFFPVHDAYPNGTALWKSDGTTAGTTRVSDVTMPHTIYLHDENNPDDYVRNVPNDYMGNVSGTLFFAAEGNDGSELWRSDGTSQGTRLVKEFDGGRPNQFRNVNGTLVFTVATGDRGHELWRSDGTAAGTRLVKDIRQGTGGSNPRELLNVGGTLFFAANDGVRGEELWRSDGTATGTFLVKDIRSGSTDSQLRYLANVSGTLFFSAADGSHGSELWRSDGRAAGTSLVKDARAGGNGSRPSSLTNVDGTLLYRADDGSGNKLWRSNGTSAGTKVVKAVSPGEAFLNLGGTLLFAADDGSGGLELWRSDGTTAGTALVHDVPDVTRGSYPLSPTNVGGTLFFQATDDDRSYKLWRSDGTATGTTLVKDLHLQSTSASHFSDDLVFLANADGKLFFDAHDGYGLWVSDGTAAGTVLVKDLVVAVHYSYGPYEDHYLKGGRTTVDDTLFLTADGGEGFELWASDGTADGTVLLKDIRPGNAGSDPDQHTNVNGTVYFSADDGIHGRELWCSDGTQAGTKMVKDIHPDIAGTELRYFVNVNGILYFSADGTNKGSELWRSDGTAAGTWRVKDINPNGSSRPSHLTNVAGTLFFGASEASYNEVLWRSDGTAAGTQPVKDLDSPIGSPRHLTNVNGRLFFASRNSLWRSDGTESGTVKVMQLPPLVNQASNDNFRFLTNFNGRLIFQGSDNVRGHNLWESDGTPGGTRIITRIERPYEYMTGRPFEVMGDSLYFAAPDGGDGVELFRYGPRADVQTIHQSDPLSGNLAGFDADGDPLTYSIISGPGHGRLVAFNSSTGAYSYRPYASFSGSDTFTYRVSDGTAESNEVTVSINVTPNSAPHLDPQIAAPFDGIAEDPARNLGTPVWKLLLGVTDSDAGAKRGVAVTYASHPANGVWQFTHDGGLTWASLGPVSLTAARLIPAAGADTRIRFVPHAHFNGDVRLTYFAWDQTRGSIGGVADISRSSERGKAKAFSSNYRPSSLTISAVNDGPILKLGGTIGYVRNQPPIILAKSAGVSDVDSANFQGGRLVVHISAGGSTSNRLLLGGGFSVDANNNVLRGTTIVGKRTSSGFGTRDLIVTFNWRVTPTVARDLVRAVMFKTVSGTSSKRTLEFTISDGDGGISHKAFKTVLVS